MRRLAIVNPRSGTLSDSMLPRLLEQLREVASDVVFTEHAGHARRIVSGAAAHEGVLVVGGDGTVLEAINGLDLGRQCLGIVPTGRGNSLARDAAVHPEAFALGHIRQGRRARIDLIDLRFEDQSGTHHQCLAASTDAVGYPARVVTVASARFRGLGSLAYGAAAACIRPVTIRVRRQLDDEVPTEGTLTGLIINNTRHLANFVGLPAASCRDGRLDVMEMRVGAIRQCLHNLSALSNLQCYTPAAVRTASAVRLDFERPQELLVDGELFANVVHVHAAVKASALDLVHGWTS